MLGGESKFLKELKKEKALSEANKKNSVTPQSDESEEEDTKAAEEEDDNTNKPYKAPLVISIDELKLNPSDNIILVLGSEGEGVSRAINRLADHRIMIPP